MEVVFQPTCNLNFVTIPISDSDMSGAIPQLGAKSTMSVFLQVLMFADYHTNPALQFMHVRSFRVFFVIMQEIAMELNGNDEYS